MNEEEEKEYKTCQEQKEEERLDIEEKNLPVDEEEFVNIEQQNAVEEQPLECDIDEVAPRIEADELIAEYTMLEQELEEFLPLDALILQEEDLEIGNSDLDSDDTFIEIDMNQNSIILEVKEKTEEEPETYEIMSTSIPKEELEVLEHQETGPQTQHDTVAEFEEQQLDAQEIESTLSCINQVIDELIAEKELTELELVHLERELEEIIDNKIITQQTEEIANKLPEDIEETNQQKELQTDRNETLKVGKNNHEEYHMELQGKDGQVNDTPEFVTIGKIDCEKMTINQEFDDDTQFHLPFTQPEIDLSSETDNHENTSTQSSINRIISQFIEITQSKYISQQQSFGLSFDENLRPQFYTDLLEVELSNLKKISKEVEFICLLNQIHSQMEEDLQRLFDVGTHQTRSELYDSLDFVSQGPALPEPPPYDFQAELEEWEEDAENRNQFIHGKLSRSFEKAEREQINAIYNFKVQYHTKKELAKIKFQKRKFSNIIKEVENYSSRKKKSIQEKQRISREFQKPKELMQKKQEITSHQYDTQDFVFLEKKEKYPYSNSRQYRTTPKLCQKPRNKRNKQKAHQNAISSKQPKNTKQKHYNNTHKSLEAIKNPNLEKLELRKTISRKRSYSITFRNNEIEKLKEFGFNEASPITLTIYDNFKNKIESYVRMMGKSTGRKINRSLTFHLGRSLGKLYGLEEREKAIIEIKQQKMLITLNKDDLTQIIVKPGINPNCTYTIRRTYSQISDYVNSFSTNDILLLEKFGFKPTDTVFLSMIDRETNKQVNRYSIRLGDKKLMGKKAYRIKLELPSEMVKECGMGNSVLIKFQISMKKMHLTLVDPQEPLKEIQEYEYYFNITPLEKKQIGISQKTIDNINRFYANYIGYEFEKICQKILPYLFPKAEIHIQKKLHKKVNDKEICIRPDAIAYEQEKPITFIDFKKSIGGIRLRTLNYLKYYPKCQLIICVLENYGWSWKESHVKNKLSSTNLSESEINSFLNRITFLNLSDITKLLPKDIIEKFEKKITKIKNKIPKDRLDVLKKTEKLVYPIIMRLSKLGVPQEDIDKINKPTRGILFKLMNLLILEELFISEYVTPYNFENRDLSINIIKKRLRQLEELGIANKIRFRLGLANKHFYYYHTKMKPKLINVLDPLASKGLKILAKNGCLLNTNLNDIEIKKIFGPHWITALRISYVLDKKKQATMKDLISIDELKSMSSNSHALWTLQKLGIVAYHRIYKELNKQDVVYFFTHEFPEDLQLSHQIPYLEPYQQLVIKEFRSKGIKIPEKTNLRDWLGRYWPLALRIYYLAMMDENLLKSKNFNIKILEHNDLNGRMNENKEAIKRALKNLHNIGILDKYPWFNKSAYYQITGTVPIPLTENPLLSEEILKPLCIIELLTNSKFLNLSHLREILSSNWNTSLKIFSVLLENVNSYPSRLSQQELIQLLRNNNIDLNHEKTLGKYIRPLKKIGIVFTFIKGRKIYYNLRI